MRKMIIRVIFLTNEGEYSFVNIGLAETDLVDYILTGKNLTFTRLCKYSKSKYHIQKILNDGGRQMSKVYEIPAFWQKRELLLSHTMVMR